MKRILFTLAIVSLICCQSNLGLAQSADSLFQEAIHAYRMEEDQQAIDLYKKAADQYSIEDNYKGHLLSLIEIASMYQVINDYDASKILLDSLRTHVSFYDDPEALFEFNEVLGYYEFEMEDNLAADSIFTLAHEYALATGDSMVLAESYSNFAFINYFLGDMEGSVNSAEQALGIFNKKGDAYKKSVIHNIIHFGLLGVFKNNLAFEKLKMSNDYAYRSKSPKMIRTTHMNFVNMLNELGQYYQALEHIKKSIKYIDKEKNLKAYIRVSINYANLLRTVGRINESNELYEQLIKDCLNKYCIDLGNIYSNLGSGYLAVNNLDLAEKSFQKADSLISKPHQSLFNTHQIQIGRFFLELNQFDLATERANSSILNTYGDSQISKTYGYILLTEIELKRDNYIKALKNAKAARANLNKDYNFLEVQTEVDFNLARAYSNIDMDTALSIGFKALDRQFSNDKFSSMFNSYSNNNSYNDELNELISWHLKNNGDKNIGVKLLQLVKNRSNIKFLQKVSEQNEDLYTNLLINDTNRFYSLLSNDKAEFTISDINNELQLATSKPESNLNPNYLRLKNTEEIRKVLGNKSVLIEYSFFKNGFIIHLMTQDDHLFKIIGDKTNGAMINELKARIDSIKNSVTSKSSISKINEDARFLYKSLIDPVESKIVDSSEIIIIPDGPIIDLPFDLLLNDGNEYLIEKHSIRYTYSTSFIVDKHFERAEVNNLFGYAASKFNGNDYLSTIRNESLSPLPNTIKEVETIGSYFSNRKILKNDHYAEDYIKRTNLNGYSHLHFATHGIVNELNPSYSKLILTDDIYDLGLTNDGHLTALEVSNLEIDAELVVLSACSTSDQYTYSSSGSMSLQKAFLIAGATGVVGTIWPVFDNSTYYFMSSFYTKILGTTTNAGLFSFIKRKKDRIRPETALQKVKIEMINHPYYNHPIYWAGYTYAGN